MLGTKKERTIQNNIHDESQHEHFTTWEDASSPSIFKLFIFSTLEDWRWKFFLLSFFLMKNLPSFFLFIETFWFPRKFHFFRLIWHQSSFSILETFFECSLQLVKLTLKFIVVHAWFCGFSNPFSSPWADRPLTISLFLFVR